MRLQLEDPNMKCLRYDVMLAPDYMCMDLMETCPDDEVTMLTVWLKEMSSENGGNTWVQ